MMRNAITTLILAGALAGGGRAAAAADKPLTGPALAERYAECWQLFNKAQWEEFSKCYAPGAVSVAAGQPSAKGAAEILEKHGKPVKAAMPDAAGEIQLTLVSGRHGATIALLRGTHTAPLVTPGGTVPPTKKRIGQLVAHAVETTPAGAVTKQWFVQDTGTFMAQLGLSKEPARPVLEKGAAEHPVVVATGSAVEKANLAAAKKAYATFNRHDKKLADLFAADVVDHDWTQPKDVHGVTEEMEHNAAFWQMSSNVKCTTPVLFAAGDYTVAVGQIVGKNDGDLPPMGLKKTGKAFTLDYIEVIRWKDGKVVEEWPFFNSFQLAMQLGLVPPPPAEKAQAQK